MGYPQQTSVKDNQAQRFNHSPPVPIDTWDSVNTLVTPSFNRAVIPLVLRIVTPLIVIIRLYRSSGWTSRGTDRSSS